MTPLGWERIAATFHVLAGDELLRFDRLPRHQEIRESARWPRVEEPPLVLLFLSHRWETPDHPDPDGRQQAAIRMLIQRIAVVAEAMWCERVERLRLVPSLDREGDLQAQAIVRRMLGWGPGADKAAAAEAKRQLAAASARDREAPGAFQTWLISRIGVWIDYSCMPQRPFSAVEEVEFRQTLGLLDRLVASSTLLALRNSGDDYTTRGWCAGEFFLGSARSFSRGLYVDIDRLRDAQPLPVPQPPVPATPDAMAAGVMTQAYADELEAWRTACEQWEALEAPLAKAHPPDAWAAYRGLQGAAFPTAAVDPNPFRRVLDLLMALETALIGGWLMSDKPRTIDAGRMIEKLVLDAGLHCAHRADLVYLGFLLACNGWIEVFQPLLRGCLQRYLDTMPSSAKEDGWPALVVTLQPLDEETRGLFAALSPARPGPWHERLRSPASSAPRERAVIEDLTERLRRTPPVFGWVDAVPPEADRIC